MGFHLASRVYAEIKGTTPTEQAILAYLAFRANDQTGKCYPSQKTIEDCTHFTHGPIINALNALRAKKILDWEKGGRKKGHGGRSFANSYTFNFDAQHTNNQQANGELINISTANPQSGNLSSIRQTDNAASARRTMQYPPDGQCNVRQTDTIIKNHNKNHTSLIIDTAQRLDVDSDLHSKSVELGKAWSASHKLPPELKKVEKRSLIEQAIEVCRVKPNDENTKKNLMLAMLSKDSSVVKDKICAFESEIKQGEHKDAKSLAAIFITRINDLPNAPTKTAT